VERKGEEREVRREDRRGEERREKRKRPGPKVNSSRKFPKMTPLPLLPS
jgi:hypothetical protein